MKAFLGESPLLFLLLAVLAGCAPAPAPVDGPAVCARSAERQPVVMSEFELLRRKESEDGAETVYSNQLKLAGRPPIPLAPTWVEKGGESYGLDAETLSVRRFPGTDLVSVSWDSYGHGSGHYINSGSMLIELASEETVVFFRDIRQTVARHGMWHQFHARLIFAVDGDRVYVILKEEFDDIAEKQLPAYIRMGQTDDGVPLYGLSYSKVSTWRYRLDRHRLHFEAGTLHYELAGKYRRNELSRVLHRQLKADGEFVSGAVPTGERLGRYHPSNDSAYGGGL